MRVLVTGARGLLGTRSSRRVRAIGTSVHRVRSRGARHRRRRAAVATPFARGAAGRGHQLRRVQRRGWRGGGAGRRRSRQRARRAARSRARRAPRGAISSTTAPTSSSTARPIAPVYRRTSPTRERLCRVEAARRLVRRRCAARTTCCGSRACSAARACGTGAAASTASSNAFGAGDEVPVFVDRTVSPSYTSDVASATRAHRSSAAPPALPLRQRRRQRRGRRSRRKRPRPRAAAAHQAAHAGDRGSRRPAAVTARCRTRSSPRRDRDAAVAGGAGALLLGRDGAAMPRCRTILILPSESLSTRSGDASRRSRGTTSARENRCRRRESAQAVSRSRRIRKSANALLRRVQLRPDAAARQT